MIVLIAELLAPPQAAAATPVNGVDPPDPLMNVCEYRNDDDAVVFWAVICPVTWIDAWLAHVGTLTVDVASWTNDAVMPNDPEFDPDVVADRAWTPEPGRAPRPRIDHAVPTRINVTTVPTA